MNFDEPEDKIKDYLTSGHKPHASSAEDLYAQAAREILIPHPSTRLVGMAKFDFITGGFRPNEYTIFCGATGTGKTTMIANLSAHLLEQKTPHFVASVETGATDFIKRVMSALARKDFNHGEAVDPADLKSFHLQHGQTVSNKLLALSLYDSRFQVAELMRDIAWHVKNHGTKIAFVDNLNFFLDVTSAEKTNHEMDRVTHELIMFCKRVNIHVFMVMHPKKTDGSRVESEFDVKGSSTAVQEAHNVLLFNRADPVRVKAGTSEEFDRELKIAKMRRRGRLTGKKLTFHCTNGVTYTEGEIL